MKLKPGDIIYMPYGRYVFSYYGNAFRSNLFVRDKNDIRVYIDEWEYPQIMKIIKNAKMS